VLLRAHRIPCFPVLLQSSPRARASTSPFSWCAWRTARRTLAAVATTSCLRTAPTTGLAGTCSRCSSRSPRVLRTLVLCTSLAAATCSTYTPPARECDVRVCRGFAVPAAPHPSSFVHACLQWPVDGVPLRDADAARAVELEARRRRTPLAPQRLPRAGGGCRHRGPTLCSSLPIADCERALPSVLLSAHPHVRPAPPSRPQTAPTTSSSASRRRCRASVSRRPSTL
jgi:hypothetical protein